MSEDESRRAGHEEETEEVEGHGRHTGAMNEEAGDETDNDDDVEGHARRAAPDAEGGRAI